MVAAHPTTHPTWVPAHKDVEYYVARGVTPRQWEGNQHADHMAKEAVHAIAPSADTAHTRNKTITILLKAQEVISTIQGLVLDHKRASPLGRASKMKRQRNLRTALLKRLAHRTHAKRPKVDPAHLVHSAQHPGVHRLQPARGPLPLHVGLKRPFPWRASCLACNASAPDTAAWTRLARTACPASIQQDHRFTRGLHDIQRAEHGWQCLRCLLPIHVNHRAKLARAQCPVPLLVDSRDAELGLARPALRTSSLLAREWCAINLGSSARGLATQAPPDVAPAPPPPRLQLRWE